MTSADNPWQECRLPALGSLLPRSDWLMRWRWLPCPGAGYTRIDALALALASGKTITEAAVAAELSRRTVTRRVADPDFRRRVAELRAEMVARALGKMADGMAAAAETLRTSLDAEGESVRLGAARSILEMGNKLREAVELEERVAELEQRLAERGAS